jgi:hypothetical protein
MLAGMLAAALPLSPAQAETEVVTLERLGVRDAIYLPTVRAQRELIFTRPKTWKLAPSSTIEATFQHSIELIPNRSWLQVILNDKVLKHVPLGPNNAEGTTLKVPIPVAQLQDFNHLIFRVEQHYVDKCEDPLDPSLWTNILPTSKLVLNYSQTLPQLDLGLFPYPVIDTLAYAPSKIRYVIPQQPGKEALTALATLNTHFAQAAHDKPKLATDLFLASESPTSLAPEHMVLIGTPQELGGWLSWGMGKAAPANGVSLQGTTWMGPSGALDPRSGVVYLAPHPNIPGYAVVVISGNGPEGVRRAAQYLTTNPHELGLQGVGAIAREDWAPQNRMGGENTGFIANSSRSFRDLGFTTQNVEKINAPPITYRIPVVSEFRNTDGRMFLDLFYSYGPKLNPTFSSLEIRVNDRSIQNIPLMNVMGEERAHASIEVPRNLVRDNNTVVAQFHLLPEKYGFCVDNYEDKAWGRIHDDSMVKVEGGPKNQLPKLGLLNDALGYPYTKTHSLSGLHVMVDTHAAPEPTKAVLRTLLGVTTRLGRATQAAPFIDLSVDDVTAPVPGGRSAIAISPAGTLPEGLKKSLKMQASAAGYAGGKVLSTQYATANVKDDGSGAFLEQASLNGSPDLMLTVLSGDPEQALLPKLFENDLKFETLSGAKSLAQVLASDGTVKQADEPILVVENPNATTSANWWSNLAALDWKAWLLGGVIAVVLVLILLPLLVRMVMRLLGR